MKNSSKRENKNKYQYPGLDQVEKEKNKAAAAKNGKPEFINGKPNYNAFPGWTAKKVLAFLNID